MGADEQPGLTYANRFSPTSSAKRGFHRRRIHHLGGPHRAATTGHGDGHDRLSLVRAAAQTGDKTTRGEARITQSESIGEALHARACLGTQSNHKIASNHPPDHSFDLDIYIVHNAGLARADVHCETRYSLGCSRPLVKNILLRTGYLAYHIHREQASLGLLCRRKRV